MKGPLKSGRSAIQPPPGHYFSRQCANGLICLAGKVRDLGKQRTLAVQDHQRIPRGGASGFLLSAPFSEATCGNWVAAREAAERGRGMGHVRVTGAVGHDQVRQRMLAGPRAAAVIAGLLAGCGGLLPERVGDDGAGDGHGCVPPWRIDGDHADDGVGGVRADDAGGPAPGRLAGCRREGYRVRKPGRSRAAKPAKILFVTTACLETS